MYWVLVGKPEGKRQLGKTWYSWEDDTKMNAKEIGFVWTGLIWLRIGANGRLCEHGIIPLGSTKFGEVCD
jgi:hypothetical protein